MALVSHRKRYDLPFSLLNLENENRYTIRTYKPIVDFLNNKRSNIRVWQQEVPYIYKNSLQKNKSKKGFDFEDEEQRLSEVRKKTGHINKSLINWSVHGHFNPTRNLDPELVTSSLPETILERAIMRDVEREQDGHSKDRKEYRRFLRNQQRYEDCQDAELSRKIRCAVRGKSPDAIAKALSNSEDKYVLRKIALTKPKLIFGV